MIAEYEIAGPNGLVDDAGVMFVDDVSFDGNGSFMVEATEPTTVMLYELGDIDVESAYIVYSAQLRTENVDGDVYLEMLCRFPDGEQYFSRAIETPVTGTSEWTAQETPFVLEAGQNPTGVSLNLVVDGTGKAWIDQIKVWRVPAG